MKTEMDLTDKVAIVTGSSRGIGRAIALKLASRKARVVINYSRNAEQAEEVVELIRKGGGEAIHVQADVSQAADIQHLFNVTVSKFGGVDIVVNNAGVILYKPVAATTDEEFDRLFAINVRGTFLSCREAIRHLRKGGRIINFSSSTTAMMLPTYATYCATKGAVEQFSHVLAKELGAQQVTVNVVSPGPTETELFFEGKDAATIQRLTQMAALGRLGKPEDIANVVAFLASDEAHWITGQNIRVNGGVI